MTNLVVRCLKWLPLLGIVLILAGFAIAIQMRAFTDAASSLSILGVLLFLLIFVRGESANVKFYVNVAVASALTLGIFTLIYLMVDGRQLTWDTTIDKRYSLSDQTQKYLRSLETPVRLIGFFGETTNPPGVVARELLDRYAALSDQVSVEIVDPVRENIRLAGFKERFDTEVYPQDIFVQNASPLEEGQKPRFKRVNRLDEGALTNAVIEISQEKPLTVYVLQGHGQKTTDFMPTGQKDHSISELRRQLTDRAMNVEHLTLRGFVPDDCDILLVVGPTADLFEPEVGILKEYLDRGGRALFFFDPPTAPGARLDNWAALLTNYGIELRPNIVLDYSGAALGNPALVVVSEYDSYHEITKDLRSPAMLVESVELAKAANLPPGFTATELMKTSPQAWTRSIEEFRREITARRITPPPQDQMKALPLAIAANETTGEGGARLVVFADADMISDNQINDVTFTLALLSLHWLGGQANLVAIPPRTIEDTPLFLSDADMSMIFIFVVVALPAAVFFGGLSYTMMRRRSR